MERCVQAYLEWHRSGLEHLQAALQTKNTFLNDWGRTTNVHSVKRDVSHVNYQAERSTQLL